MSDKNNKYLIPTEASLETVYRKIYEEDTNTFRIYYRENGSRVLTPMNIRLAYTGSAIKVYSEDMKKTVEIPKEQIKAFALTAIRAALTNVVSKKDIHIVEV